MPSAFTERQMPYPLRKILDYSLFTLLCLFCTSHSMVAQLGGKTVFNSLNIYGSARVAAMGGTYISTKDGDINLVAANPALIDSSVDGKLALSYVDYYAKTNMGYAGFARSLGKKKYTFAATMQFISYGTMDRLDALGNNIGEFSAGDYNLTLGMGYQVDSLWSVGVNLKTVYSSLDTYYSLANALDFGVIYNKPSKRFSAALLIRNMGMQWRTYVKGTRDKLPFELLLAMTKKPENAPFRFVITAGNLQQWDLTYDNPNAVVITDPTTGQATIQKAKFEFGDKLMRHIVVGTEILLGPNFNIRLGYNYLRRQELKLVDKPATSGISLGFGMKVKRFNLSYGRAIYHVAGPSNHITLSTDLDLWY